MKKVILLALGMVFLTNCGNNVAVKPENRESFTENPYFKSSEFLSQENHEKELEAIKEVECNTFLEALEKTFIWQDEVWEKVLNDKKSMDYVKKIESIAKSKFYSLKSGMGGGICYIFFTVEKGNNVFGKAGKNGMVVVYFDFLVRDVKNVENEKEIVFGRIRINPFS